jgi:hypothetical protein
MRILSICFLFFSVKEGWSECVLLTHSCKSGKHSSGLFNARGRVPSPVWRSKQAHGLSLLQVPVSDVVRERAAPEFISQVRFLFRNFRLLFAYQSATNKLVDGNACALTHLPF